MSTHNIEPMKYGGNRSDDYVTGWNDCYAAIEADRKRTAKQLSAYESLVASLEAKCTHMRKMYDELKTRTNPDLLASERAANTILTEELEADRQRWGETVARSDKQIVDQTEELARLLMLEFYSREAPENTLFRNADNPRGEHVWRVACQAQEMLTATDPENSVAEIDEAPQPAEPYVAPMSDKPVCGAQNEFHAQQPALYQYRDHPVGSDIRCGWVECSREHYEECLREPVFNGWRREVRALWEQPTVKPVKVPSKPEGENYG